MPKQEMGIRRHWSFRPIRVKEQPRLWYDFSGNDLWVRLSGPRPEWVDVTPGSPSTSLAEGPRNPNLASMTSGGDRGGHPYLLGSIVYMGLSHCC